ncbi:MAG: hypothetical protein COV45_05150 [Deltaproteobacteria bacterium CG11_big_fil_rev_8_21_14_0_20_47_16]|nr:MAG: hypothetical protein COV45_05150 [Deltaproteobacteria bacterium CG11_big_fil_rev_8_21_14_0_20_47_16]
MRMLVIFIFLSLFGVKVSLAHEGERHIESQPPTLVEDASLLKAINAEYLATIKPIFRRACFDCHSTQTQYPWYHNIPGIKQWIDSDIKEARKHLDMTNDFPFQGHGSPQKDFEAIRKTIQQNTMPPFRYKMMHWDAGLTASEKEGVLKWIDDNQKKVQN